jgi:hypothetical protein
VDTGCTSEETATWIQVKREIMRSTSRSGAQGRVLVIQERGEKVREIFRGIVEANDGETVDRLFGIGRLM